MIVVMDAVASGKSMGVRPMSDFKLATWFAMISSIDEVGVPHDLDVLMYATEAPIAC